jgi:hypothetical protein
MKRKIYLKISNKTLKMVASAKKDDKPLLFNRGTYAGIKYYPTCLIKLNIEIPDEVFEKAQAELNLKIENPQINSQIAIEEEKEVLEND